MHEKHDYRRSGESAEELDEIKARALDALKGRSRSYSQKDSVARARAVVEAIARTRDMM